MHAISTEITINCPHLWDVATQTELAPPNAEQDALHIASLKQILLCIEDKSVQSTRPVDLCYLVHVLKFDDRSTPVFLGEACMASYR